MHDNNAIGTWFQLDLLNFGLRVKNNYFTFTSALKTDFRLAFRKDLPAFLIQGNAYPGNEELTFLKDDFLSLNAYLELGLGYNREINDKLSVGINLKYLSGLANAYSEKVDVTLATSDNYSDLTLKYNVLGKFACIVDVIGSYGNDGFSSISGIMNSFKNHGFAVDIGGRYKLNKRLEFNAAVLDIGAINWKSNAYQYQVPEKTFTFSGYNVNGDVLENYGTIQDSIVKYFGDMADSIMHSFSSDIEQTASYRKWLNTRFTIGASFHISSDDRINGNFRGTFVNGAFIPSGSLSYARKCGKWFDFVVGNTFRPHAAFNPGLGLNLTLFVLQIYTVVDYANTVIYIDKVKNVNVVAGINFVFPQKKDKKENKKTKEPAKSVETNKPAETDKPEDKKE